MELLLKYFPELTSRQIEQFSTLGRVYSEWNEKVNVVSRKDIVNLYERHLLHSLSIARFITFKPGAKVMDLGTGGGFPGIPLAIMFPDSRFHLVDSIAKKLKVIDAVKEATGLTNVFTFHARAEEMDFKYDFVVSRAVAPLADLLRWSKGKYLAKNLHPIPNGLICLKGGQLEEELQQAKARQIEKIPLSNYFEGSFFADKFLLYVPHQPR